MGAGNRIQSANATLTVLIPASITLHPASVEVRVLPDSGPDVAPTTNASFAVVATTQNPPLSYQWRLAGTNLPLSAKYTGSPVLEGAIAYIECTVNAVHPGGDHTIIVGDAVNGDAPGGEPLAYFRGSYRRLESLTDPQQVWW